MARYVGRSKGETRTATSKDRLLELSFYRIRNEWVGLE